MKIKIVLALFAMWILTGCSGLFGPDKEGWRSGQKKEFLKILKQDDYLSICNQKLLYEAVNEIKIQN